LVIPGLYGYRMDSADGRRYWGLVGAAHAWDDYLSQSNPNPANAPQALARFSCAGFYAGVAVCLLALWAVLRSLSPNQKAFTPVERKLIWFWALMAFLSLLLSWGRHAPFYQLFYQLPYFSSIRNPIKFLHPLSFSLLFLFAYGLQGMWRLYLEGEGRPSGAFGQQVRKWWADAPKFDRGWSIGLALFLVAVFWGTLVFMGSKASTVSYLQLVGFAAPAGLAEETFAGGASELVWGLLFIALTSVVVWLIVVGMFRGKRAALAFMVLGGVLVVDLMRANMPWVVHYPYQERYASRPLYEVLSDHAYEHRVSTPLPLIQAQISWGLPRLQDQQTANAILGIVQNLVQIYGVEWKQHQYPYFNIQTLDIVQEPRASLENTRYRDAFPQTDPQAYLRMLKLTNTRYLLAMADPFLTPLNELNGDAPGEFRVVQRIGMEQSGEFVRPTVDTNSPLALLEFTGVLPRAKLYANWEVMEDEGAALKRLADPAFDIYESVIVDQALGEPGAPGTEAGSVVFESYAPKHIRLKADAAARSVLLLNDKFDPNWVVTVDGEPAELFRANYLMRGVALEPGEHVVEFRFRPPSSGLYISLLAIAVGGGLCGWLGVSERRVPVAEKK
jgi:hypothetical protein